MPTPPVAAIFNSSPDTIDMLRTVFERAGIVVVSGFTYDIRDGKLELEAFMRQHHPNVVVYDIAPPYDGNWQLLLHLRSTPALKHLPFVLTSTNASYVQRLAQSDERIYEVIGKPYDLEQIVQATNEAIQRSLTSY